MAECRKKHLKKTITSDDGRRRRFFFLFESFTMFLLSLYVEIEETQSYNFVKVRRRKALQNVEIWTCWAKALYRTVWIQIKSMLMTRAQRLLSMWKGSFIYKTFLISSNWYNHQVRFLNQWDTFNSLWVVGHYIYIILCRCDKTSDGIESLQEVIKYWKKSTCPRMRWLRSYSHICCHAAGTLDLFLFTCNDI